MIEQILLAFFGVTAIGFSQANNKLANKWAPVFGLCSQPFWFYATFVAQQWGIFFLCFLYTAAWGFGLYNQWFKNEELSD